MNPAASPVIAFRHAQTIRMIIWIIAVQAAFWSLALLVRPPVIDPVFKQNRLADVALQGPDGQMREPGGRPNYYLGEGREARFVATVRLDSPDQGLVVFAPRYNRWARLSVNGQVIPLSDAPAWRGGRLGGKWVVPPGFLRAGRNVLTLDIGRECCRAYLAALIAAPPGPIDRAIRQWRLQSALPPIGLMVLGLFGAVSCLMAAGRSPYRQLGHAAALAFIGMALGGVWQIDVLTPSSEPLYGAAGQLTLLATFSGLVALADRWFPGGPRFDRYLTVLAPAFFVVIAATAFTTDGMPTLLRNLVDTTIVVLANIAIIACVRRGLQQDRQAWIPDAAVVLLVPSISLADLIDSIQVDPLALSIAPLGVLALAILLMLGIVRRARMLSRRLEDANILLDARIAEKQAELEATAELLRQREAEAAVQGERSRIMRDMHDGMGGQLLSVLMLSRDENSPRHMITRTVEQAIDDLRLLIDSLDSVGDTMDIALGQFRERAETKLRAAGMKLVWSNALDGHSIMLAPGAILAVYRIMQEAINNAVRHSGGQVVSLAISRYGSNGIEIAIADDGRPGAGLWKRGRGLSNMEMRAQTIGGSLAIETGAHGTRVVLRIPAH
ncbi:signal transduction histidine kinase [Blastomonas natatoria]|uniref:histidine kinase n=1 Tax=Blastomonas natatoria TaxID=34015 RepID=A0A2V3VC54_9SPHN|nr:ATP-binding protein [Blastomonas natatoria]PXW79396.1 signal transduction histidine kinase [Blastomonas natatoria]